LAHVGSSDRRPQDPVTGTDTYNVLPGGYFLLHRLDVTVGEHPVRAVAIIGEPDVASGGFLARSFDTDGNGELMRVTIDDDGVFHFTGGAEAATAAQPTDTATAQVRFTLTIAEDGRAMTVRACGHHGVYETHSATGTSTR
jgi:hypothetical protein